MERKLISFIILGIWFLMGIVANVLVILETIKRKEALSVKDIFLSIIMGLFFAPIFLWFAFDVCDFQFIRFIQRKWYGFWNYKIINGGK